MYLVRVRNVEYFVSNIRYEFIEIRLKKMDFIKFVFVVFFAIIACAYCLERFDTENLRVSNDLSQFDNNPDEDVSSSLRLQLMLERGKELLRILPRIGGLIARKFIDIIPTPGGIMNFGKQTLIGMPQEVIAYAINAVCELRLNLCV